MVLSSDANSQLLEILKTLWRNRKSSSESCLLCDKIILKLCQHTRRFQHACCLRENADKSLAKTSALGLTGLKKHKPLQDVIITMEKTSADEDTPAKSGNHICFGALVRFRHGTRTQTLINTPIRKAYCIHMHMFLIPAASLTLAAAPAYNGRRGDGGERL